MDLLPPGLRLDQPPLAPSPFWLWGRNVRFFDGGVETVGLHTKALRGDDTPIQLPGADIYRTAYSSPSVSEGQILLASASQVQMLDFDPLSIPGTGTRWRPHDITPSPLAAVSDVVTNPSAGRTEIPPVWWYTDTEALILGGRSGVALDPVYVWDRVRTNVMVPLANAPTGAVGGGILGRILVLLGCTSRTDPTTERFMVIRWSARFNFEDWTPNDTNTSGELLLEGGSRIVGGGVVAQGVVAWTDKRMALLTETGDPSSVFARRYVDGSRGLLANRAWCESDGIVWWLDETRTLNRWEGGRPVQIPNPIKMATLERLPDHEAARVHMVANPEHGEILIWYPAPADPSQWNALVYNGAMNAWSFWVFDRPAWGPRLGVIRNVAVDSSGQVFFHDVDSALDGAFFPRFFGEDVPGPVLGPVAEPFDWALATNLITTETPTEQTHKLTRYMLDNVTASRGQGDTDAMQMTLIGYGEGSGVQGPTFETVDTRTIGRGQSEQDFRVAGRAVQMQVFGQGHRTVWRLGRHAATLRPNGRR